MNLFPVKDTAALKQNAAANAQMVGPQGRSAAEVYNGAANARGPQGVQGPPGPSASDFHLDGSKPVTFSLLPQADKTDSLNLGSASRPFAEVHVEEGYIGSGIATSTTLSTNDTNAPRFIRFQDQGQPVSYTYKMPKTDPVTGKVVTALDATTGKYEIVYETVSDGSLPVQTGVTNLWPNAHDAMTLGKPTAWFRSIHVLRNYNSSNTIYVVSDDGQDQMSMSFDLARQKQLITRGTNMVLNVDVSRVTQKFTLDVINFSGISFLSFLNFASTFVPDGPPATMFVRYMTQLLLAQKLFRTQEDGSLVSLVPSEADGAPSIAQIAGYANLMNGQYIILNDSDGVQFLASAVAALERAGVYRFPDSLLDVEFKLEYFPESGDVFLPRSICFIPNVQVDMDNHRMVVTWFKFELEYDGPFVTSAMLSQNAVVSSLLAQNAVVENALQERVITALQLANGAVGTRELGEGSVSTAALQDFAVRPEVHFSASASLLTADEHFVFPTVKLTLSDLVGGGLLLGLVFGSGKIRSGAVSRTTQFAPGAVTGPAIVDGSIGVEKFANNLRAIFSAGPQGTVGERGFQGAVGPIGVTGATGSRGSVGIQGERGPQGVQGQTGQTGGKGPQGVQGDRGETGDVGGNGPQGVQGLRGETGDMGETGLVGGKGVAGGMGPQGNRGVQGVQGEPGPKGESGDIFQTLQVSIAEQPNAWYDFGDGASVLSASSNLPVGTGANNVIVRTVLDKSGNNFHLYTRDSAYLRNTYYASSASTGKPYISTVTTGSVAMDATKTGFATASGATPIFTNGATLFFVVRPTGNFLSRSLISKTTANYSHPFDLTTDRGFGSGTSSTIGGMASTSFLNPTVARTQPVLACFNYDVSSGYYSEYLNGTRVYNNAFNKSLFQDTGGSATRLMVAARADSAVQGYLELGELICYDGNLSAASRQMIEGYLAHKWGLASTLPAGHPYLSGPPSSVFTPVAAQPTTTVNVGQGPTGVQGPQGVQGMTGSQGPVGNQGQTGAQGKIGETGPAGIQGPRGVDGYQGESGPPGVDGDRGIQGVGGVQGGIGNQGSTGPQGKTGAQGFDGEIGPQGDAGGVGAQGPQGYRGFQGDRGPQGVQGISGAPGVQGVDGPQGVQGVGGDRGPQGVTGAKGNQGVEGDPGVVGNQGVDGAQGPAGFDGFQGVPGVVGAQGPAGNQGELGPGGVQGPDGYQGIQGPAAASTIRGPDGYQGVQGPDGYQGNQGYQGVVGEATNTGPQGLTGPQGYQGNQGVQSASAGPQGFDGRQGAQGSQGPIGVQGPAGNAGFGGYQGFQGVAGAQGNVGPQGATSTVAGPQGKDGLKFDYASRSESERVRLVPPTPAPSLHLDSASLITGTSVTLTSEQVAQESEAGLYEFSGSSKDVSDALSTFYGSFAGATELNQKWSSAAANYAADTGDYVGSTTTSNVVLVPEQRDAQTGAILQAAVTDSIAGEFLQVHFPRRAVVKRLDLQSGSRVSNVVATPGVLVNSINGVDVVRPNSGYTALLFPGSSVPGETKVYSFRLYDTTDKLPLRILAVAGGGGAKQTLYYTSESYTSGGGAGELVAAQYALTASSARTFRVVVGAGGRSVRGGPGDKCEGGGNTMIFCDEDPALRIIALGGGAGLAQPDGLAYAMRGASGRGGSSAGSTFIRNFEYVDDAMPVNNFLGNNFESVNDSGIATLNSNDGTRHNTSEVLRFGNRGSTVSKSGGGAGGVPTESSAGPGLAPGNSITGFEFMNHQLYFAGGGGGSGGFGGNSGGIGGGGAGASIGVHLGVNGDHSIYPCSAPRMDLTTWTWGLAPYYSDKQCCAVACSRNVGATNPSSSSPTMIVVDFGEYVYYSPSFGAERRKSMVNGSLYFGSEYSSCCISADGTCSFVGSSSFNPSGGVYKSTDGGKTYTQVFYYTTNSASVAAVFCGSGSGYSGPGANLVLALRYDSVNGPAIYRWTDGVAVVDSVASAPSVQTLADVPGVAIGTTNFEWRLRGSTSGQYVYLSLGAQRFYRSNDYGDSWTNLSSSLLIPAVVAADATADVSAPVFGGVCCSDNGQYVYVGFHPSSSVQGVLVSQDYGATFTFLAGKTALGTDNTSTELVRRLTDLTCSSSGAVVMGVGSEAAVFRSDDYGSSWKVARSFTDTKLLQACMSSDGQAVAIAVREGNNRGVLLAGATQGYGTSAAPCSGGGGGAGQVFFQSFEPSGRLAAGTDADCGHGGSGFVMVAIPTGFLENGQVQILQEGSAGVAALQDAQALAAPYIESGDRLRYWFQFHESNVMYFAAESYICNFSLSPEVMNLQNYMHRVVRSVIVDTNDQPVLGGQCGVALNPMWGSRGDQRQGFWEAQGDTMDGSLLSGTQSFTFSVWIRYCPSLPQGGEKGAVFVLRNQRTGGFTGIYIDGSSKKVQCVCENNFGAALTCTVAEDAKWHHYVWVLSPTAWTLYRDGEVNVELSAVQLGATSSVSSFFDQPSSTTFVPYLGNQYNQTNYYYGKLSESRFYTRAITEGDVARLYANKNKKVDTNRPKLIRHYTFDDVDWYTRDYAGNDGNLYLERGNGANIDPSYKKTGRASLKINNGGAPTYMPRVEVNSGALTIAFWMKAQFASNGGSSGGVFLSLSNPTRNCMLRLNLQRDYSSGSNSTFWNSSFDIQLTVNGTMYTYNVKIGEMNDNNFIHACLLFNQEGIYMYRNGVLFDAVLVNNIPALPTPITFFENYMNPGGGDPNDLFLDDFRIYDGEITNSMLRGLQSLGYVQAPRVRVVSSGLDPVTGETLVTLKWQTLNGALDSVALRINPAPPVGMTYSSPVVETSNGVTLRGLDYGVYYYYFWLELQRGSTVAVGDSSVYPTAVKAFFAEGYPQFDVPGRAVLQWTYSKTQNNQDVNLSYVAAEITWSPTTAVSQPYQFSRGNGATSATITGFAADTNYTFTIKTDFGTQEYAVYGYTISAPLSFAAPLTVLSGAQPSLIAMGDYTMLIFGADSVVQLKDLGTTEYCFAVVGGGGAGGDPTTTAGYGTGGTGGGAGGQVTFFRVAPTSESGISYAQTTDQMTITVGAGGSGVGTSSGNGGASSVSFQTNTSWNLTAVGGAMGGQYGNKSNNAVTNGHSGGSGADAASNPSAESRTSGKRFEAGTGVNRGGSGGVLGGGGGAGEGGAGYGCSGYLGFIDAASNGSTTKTYANNLFGTNGTRNDGGPGIVIPLPGFSSVKYFGGGGGGCCSYLSKTSAGSGGRGGGAAGSSASSATGTFSATSDTTYGINAATTVNSTTYIGGNGGVNTGGGGGGSWATRGGNGGSGVVVVVMRAKVSETNPIAFVDTYPSFSSTGIAHLQWTVSTPCNVAVTWSPPTNVTQPLVVGAGTTSTSLSGFLPDVAYTFRISAISTAQSGSAVNTIVSRALSSAIKYMPLYRDLSISQTVCRSMAISSNGTYILLGNENGVFVSGNNGLSFTAKSTYAPFTTSNYNSFISDNGNYVLLYSPGNTTSAYHLSTDGGITFTAKTVLAAGFTLYTIAASTTGQYMFASGNGTNGGIFTSTDYGSTFTRKVTSTTAQGCGCSPNGRTVVVAGNGTAPWSSSDYGATFATFGSTTYSGRRVFVHPNEYYFAMRAVTTDAFLYTDTSLANFALTSTTYKSSATQTLITGTPADVEGYAGIDINGRYYYITSSNLYWFDPTFTTRTQVSLGTSLTDSRLAMTPDARYMVAFGATNKFKLIRLVTETNTVTIAAATFNSTTKLVNLSWTLATGNRAVQIRWTPTTGTSQAYAVAAGTTSVSLSGFTSASVDTTYYFTVSVLDSAGNMITAQATSSGVFIPIQYTIPTDAMMIHLPFNASDLSGTTLTNYGTMGNATASGGFTCNRTVGRSGFQGTFGGSTTSFITMPTYTLVSGTSYTFSFFIRPNRAAGVNTNLFVLSYNTYNDALICEVDTTNKLCISGPGNKTITDSTYNYNTANTWIHIAVVYILGASSSTQKLYLNGTLKTTYTIGQATNFTSARAFQIGNATWDSAQYINGSLQNFRMYSRELTANEVKACYQLDNTDFIASTDILDVAWGQTTLRTLFSSRSGEFLFLGNENGMWILNGYGSGTLTKVNTYAPYTTTNYYGCISDDGQKIVIYQLYDATCTYRYSLDGGANWTTSTIVSPAVRLQAICMSSDASYIYASADATGGVFRSTNLFSTFTKVNTTTIVMGCACSPSGRCVAVSSNSPTSMLLISEDYGNTFYVAGSTVMSVFYPRRAYMHPFENYSAIRAVASDVFVYSSASSNMCNLVATTSTVTATAGDDEHRTMLDRNGRFYYITGNTLTFFNSSFSKSVTVFGATFSDQRLAVSTNGKYMFGFNAGVVKVLTLLSETNTIALDGDQSMNNFGQAILKWTLASSAAVNVYWYPPTLTAQPYSFASGVLSGMVGGFLPNVTYRLILVSMSSGGDYITSQVMVSLSTVTIPFPGARLMHYDPSDVTKVLNSSDGSITNNTAVKTLKDLSLNGNDMTTRDTSYSNTRNYYKTSGLGYCEMPCVSVAGTGAGTSCGFRTAAYPDFSQGVDLFIVVRPLLAYNNAAAGLVLNKTTSSYSNPFSIQHSATQIGSGTSTTVVSYSYNTYTETSAVTNGFLLNVSISKTSSNYVITVRRNGTQLYTVTETNATNLAYYVDNAAKYAYLFAREDNPSVRDTEFGEVIVLGAPLSPNNRYLVEGYLAKKWKLFTSRYLLQDWAAHPYFNLPVSFATSPTLFLEVTSDMVHPLNFFNGGAFYIDSNSTGQYVLVGLKGTIYSSSNYGVTWTRNTFVSGTSLLDFGCVRFIGDGSFQLACSTGVPECAIYRSTNYGSTWTKITSISTNNSGRYVMDFTIDSVLGNSDNIFVTGGGYAGQQNYRSTDAGLTFAKVDTTYNYGAYTACLINGTAYIIIFNNYNGPSTRFQAYKQAVFPTGGALVLLAPTNWFATAGIRPRILAVGTTIYIYNGANSIKKSTDYLVTMEDCSYPPTSEYIRCFQFDAAGTLYACNSRFIFTCPNYGTGTWRSYTNLNLIDIISAHVPSDGSCMYLLCNTSSQVRLHKYVFDSNNPNGGSLV